MSKSNIIFIGSPAVGKTTIGKALANALNKTFFDLDQVIEESCGVSITTIFEIEGENKFRERETAALYKILTTRANCILSVGGGAIVSGKNCELIQSSNSTIIQLSADIDTIIERLKKSPHSRPLFHNVDIHHKVTELSNTRQELYDQISHIKFNTTNLSLPKIIQQLQRLI